MAIIERDVVLMSKVGSDQAIDLPITRLGNVEDGADAKTTIVDADAFPVIDSQAANEMKKITWANLWSFILTKIKSLFYTKDESNKQLEQKLSLLGGDMSGNLGLGKNRLSFNIPGKHGFYLINDGNSLAIQDHDDHVLLRCNYNSVPTTIGGTPFATATPKVTQLTPLNGFAKTENNICKLSDCGAAKIIDAELKFLSTAPSGTAIMYTGVTGVNKPIVCDAFDSAGLEFLGRFVAWHYDDGRVATYGYIGYDPAKGDYNRLFINSVIGG